MAAPASIEVHGTHDKAFEPVRRAFEENFTEHGELGAAVSVVVDGKAVVDLWAGHADASRDRPWERDTIVNVYSTTKGMAALCGHILADRGQLDFEAPVVEYWPEFGQAGKETMPVAYLFSHQAGLYAVTAELKGDEALDWDTMTGLLAAQEPLWTPGEKQGYHAVTFGYLVGEIVRRISGRTIGAFLADEVTGPLGVDFLIGTPAGEDHRIADMQQPAPPPADAPASPLNDPDGPFARATRMRSNLDVNSREWRAAEIPSSNGHGNARALARIYGALARGGEIDGVSLLSAEAIKRAAAERVSSHDEVLPMATRRSLGYMLPLGDLDQRGPNAFGHAGMGGSLGYADPDTKLGFGYVMNQMWSGGMMSPDPRAGSLVKALNESL